MPTLQQPHLDVQVHSVRSHCLFFVKSCEVLMPLLNPLPLRVNTCKYHLWFPQINISNELILNRFFLPRFRGIEYSSFVLPPKKEIKQSIPTKLVKLCDMCFCAFFFFGSNFGFKISMVNRLSTMMNPI